MDCIVCGVAESDTTEQLSLYLSCEWHPQGAHSGVQGWRGHFLSQASASRPEDQTPQVQGVPVATGETAEVAVPGAQGCTQRGGRSPC